MQRGARRATPSTAPSSVVTTPRQKAGLAPPRTGSRPGLLAALGALAVLGAGGAGAFTTGGAAEAATPTTVYVSTTGTSGATDSGCDSAAYATIQTAVDAVAAGGTVHVCPGTYRTTVSVTTADVSVVGAGPSSVLAPSTVGCETVATSFTGDHVWAPIIEVAGGASGVAISDIRVDGNAVTTVDGSSATRCSLVGVLFDGASGAVTDASVDGIAGSSDKTKDVAIALLGGTVTVARSKVSGYESNGVICDSGSVCNLTDDAVTGTGATAAVPQVGIQVSGGSSGTVSGNTVDDNAYAKSTTESIGVLVLESSDLSVTGNTLTDDQAAMVVGSFGHSNHAAMGTVRVTDNAIGYDTSFGGFGTTIVGVYLFADSPGSVTAIVEHNSIEGPGTGHAGIAGLQLGTQYSYGAYRTRFRYGQVDVTATDNRFSAWHTDVLASGGAVTAQLYDNDLLGGPSVVGVANRSRTVGVGTTAISMVNATDDWWGCTTGPDAPGCSTTSGSVGTAPWLDSVASTVPAGPGGYWLAATDGSVYSFGMAASHGSMAGQHLNAPIVGMAVDPVTGGYWLVAADGGIFSFGTARFHGSMAAVHLQAPIVGMAADPATGGYWLVASDGGMFNFAAPFEGSLGGQRLHAPVVGMAVTATDNGYWLAASDGGVFSFGTASYRGSLTATHLSSPVTGIAADPATGGYWLVSSAGAVSTFTTPFEGSVSGDRPGAPIVGMTA